LGRNERIIGWFQSPSLDNSGLFTTPKARLDATSRAFVFSGTRELVLAKRIVKAHAGRLGVQSMHGQADMFFVVLPRVCQHISEFGETIECVATWAASTTSRTL
jgi:signal transduction histidine kinase